MAKKNQPERSEMIWPAAKLFPEKDVQFKVIDLQGRHISIFAHKKVLAAVSPVFKAQFYPTSSYRGESDQVGLNFDAETLYQNIQVNSCEAFEGLIDFIHGTDRVWEMTSPELIFETFLLACRFEVRNLMEVLHKKVRKFAQPEVIEAHGALNLVKMIKDPVPPLDLVISACADSLFAKVESVKDVQSIAGSLTEDTVNCQTFCLLLSLKTNLSEQINKFSAVTTTGTVEEYVPYIHFSNQSSPLDLLSASCPQTPVFPITGNSFSFLKSSQDDDGPFSPLSPDFLFTAPSPAFDPCKTFPPSTLFPQSEMSFSFLKTPVACDIPAATRSFSFQPPVLPSSKPCHRFNFQLPTLPSSTTTDPKPCYRFNFLPPTLSSGTSASKPCFGSNFQPPVLHSSTTAPKPSFTFNISLPNLSSKSTSSQFHDFDESLVKNSTISEVTLPSQDLPVFARSCETVLAAEEEDPGSPNLLDVEELFTAECSQEKPLLPSKQTFISVTTPQSANKCSSLKETDIVLKMPESVQRGTIRCKPFELLRKKDMEETKVDEVVSNTIEIIEIDDSSDQRIQARKRTYDMTEAQPCYWYPCGLPSCFNVKMSSLFNWKRHMKKIHNVCDNEFSGPLIDVNKKWRTNDIDPFDFDLPQSSTSLDLPNSRTFLELSSNNTFLESYNFNERAQL